MTERTERLTKLIARMPQDIKDEVARLDAQIVRLKLEQKEGNFSSSVGIVDIDVQQGRITHAPLPNDKPVRFYAKHLTPKQRYVSDCYVEFRHEYQQQESKVLRVEARCGFGGVRIEPSSSNCFFIIPRDRDP